MKGFRYLQDVVTLKLDQTACVGCGRCLEVCPHQVFVLVDKLASLSDRDACMECGACALNCPVKAITVDAGVGCASGMINEWLQEREAALTGRELLFLTACAAAMNYSAVSYRVSQK